MLTIRPLDLRMANAFVIANHRHNTKVTIHRFSIGVYDNERLCGVVICGNPIARKLCDGLTIEVLRCCVDGTKNACSKLYGACARIAKEMGYKKIITYILESELGTTMAASGWELDAIGCGGKCWDSPSRPRTLVDRTLFGDIIKYSTEPKKRYCKVFK